MNKKGVFFTIMTLAILSLFVVSYGVHSYVKDKSSIEKRIDTMNTFVFSIEKDLPRKLYLSGFRIIFLIEKEIAETGNYITDFDYLFNESFFNGTLNGVDHASNGGIMYGVTYDGILDSLNNKAEEINMNLNFENPVLNVSQEDPWNVKITLAGDLLIRDKGDLAKWDRAIIINSYVPITNFEDPLYFIETSGLVSHKINKSEQDAPISIANLLEYVQDGKYINSIDGPSFIDRLEGKKTETIEGTGIESLVYLPDLSAQGISVKDKSVVDYIYFNDANNPSASLVATMPSWFKLDNDHVGIYGV